MPSNVLEDEVRPPRCREGCAEPVVEDLSVHYAQFHPEKWKQIRVWNAELDAKIRTFTQVIVDQESSG
jgi:hypothetical protein